MEPLRTRYTSALQGNTVLTKTTGLHSLDTRLGWRSLHRNSRKYSKTLECRCTSGPENGNATERKQMRRGGTEPGVPLHLHNGNTAGHLNRKWNGTAAFTGKRSRTLTEDETVGRLTTSEINFKKRHEKCLRPRWLRKKKRHNVSLEEVRLLRIFDKHVHVKMMNRTDAYGGLKGSF